MINDLRILIECLLQRVDEIPRAERPPLAPTRLDFDPVHGDDDIYDDDDNNAIPK